MDYEGIKKRNDKTLDNQTEINEEELIKKLKNTIKELKSSKHKDLDWSSFINHNSYKKFKTILEKENAQKKSKRSLFDTILTNYDLILLMIVNTILIFYLACFVITYIEPESDFTVSFYEINENIYNYASEMVMKFQINVLGLADSLEDEKCIVQTPDFARVLFRPIVNCKICEGLTKIKRIENISKDEFFEKYAYTSVPVIITDAMKNWPAMTTLNFKFLKDLYNEAEHRAYKKRQSEIPKSQLKSMISTFKSIVETDEMRAENTEESTCQFFPYKSKFNSLNEVFQMETNSEGKYAKPWYVGWSNCNGYAGEVLRTLYDRPYFLPDESEMSRLDWIFMGTPGYGAQMHVDDVLNPSWQAQISGIKEWTFKPPPECQFKCDTLYVNVYPGDIIVFDSDKWFHSTNIKGEEISLTIGSEYD